VLCLHMQGPKSIHSMHKKHDSYKGAMWDIAVGATPPSLDVDHTHTRPGDMLVCAMLSSVCTGAGYQILKAVLR
jgi:hypothetical protein